jgi:hypothetical protein
MTKRGLWLLLMLFLILVGCRGRGTAGPNLGVTLAVTPQPPKVGPATVVVTLSDADGKPLSGASVKLEGNMTHAGMKPVFADATEVTAGRYEASLEFTMGGDWFIIVRATLPDGRSVEQQVDVPGVRAP